MFYEKKNVLIAGGAGMTGQSLIRKLLDAGAYVRATQYRSRKISISHKNLEVVACDLRNSESTWPLFKDMDIVFICAGIIRGAKWIKEDPSSVLMYNLDLQSKLIHFASKAKVQKCSFISSSYLYPHTGGPNEEGEGFQGDPWKPMNYGIGWYHRYLETLCKHFHMTSATDYAVVRPTAVYGPYDHFDLEDSHVIPASIMKAVSQTDPYEVWGTGEDRRCFTYIDDLTEGLMLVVEKYAVAEPMNICTTEVSAVKDVIRIILDYLNFHPKLIFRSDRPSVIPYKVSDPTKARALLRWESRISLTEGLKRTIDWYRESCSIAPQDGQLAATGSKPTSIL